MKRLNLWVRSGSLLLLTLFFSGCSNHNDIHITRLEQLIFNVDPSALQDSLLAHGDELNTPLLNVAPNDSKCMAMLHDFATDPSMQLIFHITDSIFHDLSWLERELGDALSRADGIVYDKFYTLVTGDFYDYDRRVFCSDHELAISLDHYAVQALHAGVPSYIERLSQPQYITADCMAAIARNHIDVPDGDMTLLDYTIAEGKTVYFLEQTMPRAHDTILLRYSNDQLQWMRHNTEHVWGWLLENNILYSTDLWQYHNIIDEAPKTNAFGDASAPRTPTYIGWQIVRQYMKKTGVSISELFAETDSRKILAQSGWRP